LILASWLDAVKHPRVVLLEYLPSVFGIETFRLSIVKTRIAVQYRGAFSLSADRKIAPLAHRVQAEPQAEKLHVSRNQLLSL